MRDLALESVVATRWAGPGNSLRIARDFFPLATERLGLTRCGPVGYFVLVRVCDTICVAVPSRRFGVGTDLLPLPTQRLRRARGQPMRSRGLICVRVAPWAASGGGLGVSSGDFFAGGTERLRFARCGPVRRRVLVAVIATVGVAVSGIGTCCVGTTHHGRATAELLPNPTGGLGFACGRTVR